jgi:hypothetical protein
MYKSITTSQHQKVSAVLGWYTSLRRRVLVRMIGFISSWVTCPLLITRTHRQYSAIAVAHLHTFQFTVAHALRFSVTTSRLLATDLDTGIITVSLNHTLQILHIYSSLHRCTLATNTKNSPRTTSKWASVSPINLWSDTRKNLCASTVASLLKLVTSLLTRSRDPSPLLCHSSVYSVAWQRARRGEARRCGVRRHSAWHSRAQHGTEKTPLRLLLRNCGNVFRGYGSCMA